MTVKLIRYDMARKALAEARRVDEVKTIRDKAVAMQEYARRAKDSEMIEHATEIRAHAERRAGEMLRDMAAEGSRTRGRKGKSHLQVTLSEIGITKNQSYRWQRLADMTRADFERKLKMATKKAVAAIDGTAKVERLELLRQDEERVKRLRSIDGTFRTLIIDPPWDYEWLSIAGAAPGYATMTHEQLLDLPVPAWADKDCHLYLWTTNNFMTRAVDLMAHWGFEHKTVLTWIKLSKSGKQWMGLGSYFRNTTEHVLFGIKGKLRTRRTDIKTHFEAPVGKHSEKPDAFYRLVQAASHGAYGEAFQRKERPQFKNLYEMRPEFLQAAE